MSDQIIESAKHYPIDFNMLNTSDTSEEIALEHKYILAIQTIASFDGATLEVQVSLDAAATWQTHADLLLTIVASEYFVLDKPIPLPASTVVRLVSSLAQTADTVIAVIVGP